MWQSRRTISGSARSDNAHPSWSGTVGSDPGRGTSRPYRSPRVLSGVPEAVTTTPVTLASLMPSHSENPEIIFETQGTKVSPG
jgi:hypothetical protein